MKRGGQDVHILPAVTRLVINNNTARFTFNRMREDDVE